MRIRGRRYAIDWGHLALVVGIGVGVAAYLMDARATSLNINNLLLVQPTALFALLMCALILPQCFRPAEDAGRAREDEADAAEGSEPIRIALISAALGLFVFTITVIGFDVATWLFVAAAMIICGEKRPLPLLVYPTAVTLAIVLGFRALMPYPMFTLVL